MFIVNEFRPNRSFASYEEAKKSAVEQASKPWNVTEEASFVISEIKEIVQVKIDPSVFITATIAGEDVDKAVLEKQKELNYVSN